MSTKAATLHDHLIAADPDEAAIECLRFLCSYYERSKKRGRRSISQWMRLERQSIEKFCGWRDKYDHHIGGNGKGEE